MLLRGVLLLFLLFGSAIATAQATTDNDALIREEMAYHVGVLAYIYGYPMVDMQKQMYNDTHRVSAGQTTYAPVNRFYHFKQLVTPETAGTLRAPNSDTLYFAGWFDLTEEPVIVHNPDTKGRYYTMAVTNLYAEVTHLGRRTVGTEEHYHALVGPGWEGKLPRGVKAVQLDTNKAWILGRLLVDGKSDLPVALEMLQQFWASPLSKWRRGKPLSVAIEQKAEAIDPLNTVEYFSYLNQAIRANPRRPDEAALMTQFDTIGVGPNSSFQAGELHDDLKAGLERAIIDARKLIAAASRRTIPAVNGWMISKEIGRYGHDYLHRAAVVMGGYGNLPEESLYAATLFDQKNEMLSGSKSYRIHFGKDELPPVNGFWSLAAYRVEDANLENNRIERYSIGDRTSGLQYHADGSITFHLQHKVPASGETNWLPTPAGGFYVIMRLYEPAEELLDGRYQLPPIAVAD
ncbi:MAG: DUF1254 domain-containing protein [Pseudomonadales bacterium]